MIGYSKSGCIELEMFKQIIGSIYAIWIVGIILFLLFIIFRAKLRNKYSDLNKRIIPT